jgi:phosphoribosylformimino-5-aminoimidazole carboxamide ribotide isomerase
LEIIPAIDIMAGKCIRLTKGDYSTRKVYSENPLEVAKEFEAHGIKRLHLVDLDGAKAREIINGDVLKTIAGATRLIIDFGGGVQSDRDIEFAFKSGAAKVTAGSVAVNNRVLFESWMKIYGGDRIILGADVKGEKIAIGGWEEDTGLDIYRFIDGFLPSGIQYVICTEIGRDGMLAGPAISLYKKLVLRFPGIRIIASGGVADESDIDEIQQAGVWGVIIGKAIYEGRIKIQNLGKYIS